MDFMSWEYIGTSVGATAFVLLVVQYLKAPLDKVWKIPTRALVYALSFAALFAADGFMGGLAWESIGLDVINAVIVAAAAMGAYEVIYNKTAKEVEERAGEDK